MATVRPARAKGEEGRGQMAPGREQADPLLSGSVPPIQGGVETVQEESRCMQMK